MICIFSTDSLRSNTSIEHCLLSWAGLSLHSCLKSCNYLVRQQNLQSFQDPRYQPWYLRKKNYKKILTIVWVIGETKFGAFWYGHWPLEHLFPTPPQTHSPLLLSSELHTPAISCAKVSPSSSRTLTLAGFGAFLIISRMGFGILKTIFSSFAAFFASFHLFVANL